MELWLVVQTSAGERHELAVDSAPDATVRLMTDSIAAHIGLPMGLDLFAHRSKGILDPHALVRESGLRFGETVTVAQPGWAAKVIPVQPVVAVIAVISGPAAGRRIPVPLGDYTIGRSSNADIAVDDLTLSRTHLRLVVGPDAVTVEDAGSSNGVFIGGHRVEGTQVLGAGTVVEAGHTLLQVERVAVAIRPIHPVESGHVRFNRPPRIHRPAPERIYRLPAPPEAPRRGRLPMISALGPMVIGLPMVFLGQGAMRIVGLVSCLGSPLMAMASYIEDKRGGRGEFRRATLEFYEQLAKTSREMEESLTEEVSERRRLSPAAPDLLTCIERVDASVWERRPTFADFLSVGAGWADQPSLATFELSDGGDERMREEAVSELGQWSVARGVPVVIDVQHAGVVGISGDVASVDGLARWMVVQLAATHSPREVVVALAVSAAERRDWSWTAWLPHLRSESSPIEHPHLAVGDSEAAQLFGAVSAVVRSRRTESGTRLNTTSKPLPAIVLFVSERLRVPRTAVTTILEDGSGVGVYVVWLGSATDALPGECGAVLEVSASPSSFTLITPSTGKRLERCVVDQLQLDIALEAALGLAALKDVTAGGARGQIPRRVSLPDLLLLSDLSAQRIVDRWQQATSGVDAVVGISAAGQFVLDMRNDGPHALVGGTTGAGKSELLQTFVAALAATHPPNRVTFLLVDYKGGAAFKDAVDLAHTVGMVTDLDGHLVARVLISLNAELHRREHLLSEHGVKDLLEMERRFPDLSPASLILIVDEFATLAKELPEFVEGVVNVAQRGRSLGIHLILATQRPAGAINDNVRANTNLRIALRMNDVSDSEDVIAAKDAALLPRTMPGRAFVRTGQAELTEVQIAYVGGHTLHTATSDTSVDVAAIVDGRPQRAIATSVVDDAAASDLQAIVQAVNKATEQLGVPRQPQPWLPPLPLVAPLDSLETPQAGRATLGVVDVPSRQEQRRWEWDLEDDGHLLVFGTSGAGKTTLLRTVVGSLAEAHTPDELHIYGLDFATRGLTSMSAIPHVGSVIPGDDVERVQRLISTLEREIGRRKALFADVGASLLSEYQRAAPTVDVPRIVVVLDGYSGFTSIFEKIDFGDWIERIPRLVGEGRSLGVHWVISADRRNAVGMTLTGMITARVVLRMAEDDDYASLGLDGRTARSTSLPPGRGFVGPTIEFQAALVGDQASGDAQVNAIEALGERLRSRFPGTRVPEIGSLPTSVDRASLPVPDTLQVTLGVGQSDLGPITFDLFDGNLIVAGPNRSGRSTALETIALSLRDSTPDAELYLLAPRRTHLLDLTMWTKSARGAAACDDLARELVELIDERDGSEPPIIVIVDDGNELVDAPADGALERLVRRGRDVAISVVGAAETTSALRSYGGWIPEIRKDRRAFLLNPDPDIDGDLVGARLPRRTGGGLPPGRGYLVTDGVVHLAQVASSSPG